MDALENVVNIGRICANIELASEAFSENPTDYQSVIAYTGMIFPHLDEANRTNAAKALIKGSPAAVKHNMDSALAYREGMLADAIDSDYGAFVSTLDKSQAEIFAFGASGRAKQNRDINKALGKGDYDTVRTAFAETFVEPEWKDFVLEIADEHFLREFAGDNMSYAFGGFISQFTTSRSGGNPYTDSRKLRNYLMTEIGDLSGDERKAAFVEGAKTISTVQTAQEAAAARN